MMPRCGMQFRNWTSKILKEYMQKGFVMNDERLKNPKIDEILQQDMLFSSPSYSAAFVIGGHANGSLERKPPPKRYSNLLRGGFYLTLSISSTIMFSSFSGSVVDAYLSITFPSESTRNFVKFHLIDFPKIPAVSSLRYLNRGSVFSPLTSILSNTGNVTP